VETPRGWQLVVRGKRVRRYELQASLGTLKRPFGPRSVTLTGRPLRFSYERGVLRLKFRARGGTLRVSR